MTCAHCGGACEWQGRLTRLTHTECLHCGAIDSQEPDQDECEEPEDEHK